MSPVAGAVLADLSAAPDPAFRPIIDILAGLAATDRSDGSLEVVVQRDGAEVLRARLAPPGSDPDGPLMAVCGSAFKPALALCALRVARRTGIDIDAPLGDLGVDLADGRTTLRQAIDHRAGLPHIRDVAPEPAGLIDGPGITDALRRLPPCWPPGVRTAYHAVSYGYLLTAICEDLGGRPMGELLRHHVLEPAGLGPEAVALPWVNGTHDDTVDLTVTGKPSIPWRPEGRALIYRATYPLRDLVAHLNTPASMRTPPLSCGVPCTAAALASIHRVRLDPALAGDDEASAPPPSFDHVMYQRLTWHRGALMGAGVRSMLDRPGLTGLPGYGGSLGLADARTGVTMGIISTRLEADRVVSRDAQAICDALLPALA